MRARDRRASLPVGRLASGDDRKLIARLKTRRAARERRRLRPPRRRRHVRSARRPASAGRAGIHGGRVRLYRAPLHAERAGGRRKIEYGRPKSRAAAVRPRWRTARAHKDKSSDFKLASLSAPLMLVRLYSSSPRARRRLAAWPADDDWPSLVATRAPISARASRRVVGRPLIGSRVRVGDGRLSASEL